MNTGENIMVLLKTWSDKEFEKVFDDIFSHMTRTVSTGASKIWAKWETDTRFMVGVPGLKRDDLIISVDNSKLYLEWENKYNSGNYHVKIPSKTQDIEVEIDNGMVIIDFIVQTPDISIKIK